jgi:hypothetical protein
MNCSLARYGSGSLTPTTMPYLDCTTAGQIIRYRVLFICLVHLRLDTSDQLISINGTFLSSGISLPHFSLHLMWMDCITAGQIVLYHALFICLVHLRLDSSDRLMSINWPLFGLADLLTSLQLTSNMDGLQYRRTDCTVSFSRYLPRTFAFGLFGSIDKNKLTTFWPPRSPYLTSVDI